MQLDCMCLSYKGSALLVQEQSLFLNISLCSFKHLVVIRISFYMSGSPFCSHMHVHWDDVEHSPTDVVTLFHWSTGDIQTRNAAMHQRGQGIRPQASKYGYTFKDLKYHENRFCKCFMRKETHSGCLLDLKDTHRVSVNTKFKHNLGLFSRKLHRAPMRAGQISQFIAIHQPSTCNPSKQVAFSRQGTKVHCLYFLFLRLRMMKQCICFQTSSWKNDMPVLIFILLEHDMLPSPCTGFFLPFSHY